MKKATVKRNASNGRIGEPVKNIDAQSLNAKARKTLAASVLTQRTIESVGKKHSAALTRLANR